MGSRHAELDVHVEYVKLEGLEGKKTTEKEEQKTLSKDKKDTGQDADLGPRG